MRVLFTQQKSTITERRIEKGPELLKAFKYIVALSHLFESGGSQIIQNSEYMFNRLWF